MAARTTRSRPAPLVSVPPPAPAAGGKASAVASEIRALIARGDLKPGDDLEPESALMAQYEVSQPTMRAALRILESEGLVHIRRGAGGGPTVKPLDPSTLARQAGFYLQLDGADLDDFLEALVLMQPGAIELAATRRTPEHIRALRRCVAQVAASETTSEFADASTDFVLGLLDASANKSIRMFGLVISVLIRQEIHRQIDHRLFDKSRRDRYVERFSEVVDYIEQGEGEAAAALWRVVLISSNPTRRERPPEVATARRRRR